MKKKTTVIVHDHPFVREGLKSIIATDDRYEVAAETGKAREALSLVKDLEPDLALVDLRLPDITGIELTPRDSRHAARHTGGVSQAVNKVRTLFFRQRSRFIKNRNYD